MKIREQEQQVQKVQNEEQIKAQVEVARLSMELFERRSDAWLSFLKKDSVAITIGGILLILIIRSQVGAMLFGVAPSDT